MKKTECAKIVENIGFYPEAANFLKYYKDGIFTPEKIEFYGDMSFSKAGILYADIVSTVSKTYAKEVEELEKKAEAERAGIVTGAKEDITKIIEEAAKKVAVGGDTEAAFDAFFDSAERGEQDGTEA